MSVTSKARIYRTTVRPILTYAAETRADTNRTKRVLRTTEKAMRSGSDARGCQMLSDGYGEEERSGESMSTGWETIDSQEETEHDQTLSKTTKRMS